MNAGYLLFLLYILLDIVYVMMCNYVYASLSLSALFICFRFRLTVKIIMIYVSRLLVSCKEEKKSRLYDNNTKKFVTSWYIHTYYDSAGHA